MNKKKKKKLPLKVFFSYGSSEVLLLFYLHPRKRVEPMSVWPICPKMGLHTRKV